MISPSILILHGPNLNMLGRREPSIYGSLSLDALNQSCRDFAAQWGACVECFQTNHEGEMIERVHLAVTESFDGVIINPAAWTHTSVALRDALLNLTSPLYEVHMSNIYKREMFRQKSYISDIAQGGAFGLGVQSYLAAILAICHSMPTN